MVRRGKLIESKSAHAMSRTRKAFKDNKKMQIDSRRLFVVDTIVICTSFTAGTEISQV